MPRVKGRTFTFEGASNWIGVGPMVLSTTGWKPDGAPSHMGNKMALSPRNKNGNLIKSNPKNMVWPGTFLSKTEARNLRGRKPRQNPEDGVLSFIVCVLSQYGLGASRSWRRAAEGDISSQGRSQGRADEECPHPACLDMLDLARAPETVVERLRDNWAARPTMSEPVLRGRG